MLGGFALLAIDFRNRASGQTPLCPVDDRRHHLQIPDQFGADPGRGFLLCLPLCFEEQLGSIQNAFPHSRRTLAPGRVHLAGFARIRVMLDEDRGHPLAILQALASNWHQIFQRHLRQYLALAHLLLNRFRQYLDQGQPPRYPTDAAIEPAGQLVESVAEPPR